MEFERIYELVVEAAREQPAMEFERIYELAVEAAGERVAELAFCRSVKDNSILKRMHEQAIADLTDLSRGYNQMIIDKNKEMGRNGNA